MLHKARLTVIAALATPTQELVVDARAGLVNMLILPGGWLKTTIQSAAIVRRVLLPVLIETLFVLDTMSGNWNLEIVNLIADERYCIQVVIIDYCKS